MQVPAPLRYCPAQCGGYPQHLLLACHLFDIESVLVLKLDWKLWDIELVSPEIIKKENGKIDTQCSMVTRFTSIDIFALISVSFQSKHVHLACFPYFMYIMRILNTSSSTWLYQACAENPLMKSFLESRFFNFFWMYLQQHYLLNILWKSECNINVQPTLQNEF